MRYRTRRYSWHRFDCWWSHAKCSFWHSWGWSYTSSCTSSCTKHLDQGLIGHTLLRGCRRPVQQYYISSCCRWARLHSRWLWWWWLWSHGSSRSSGWGSHTIVGLCPVPFHQLSLLPQPVLLHLLCLAISLFALLSRSWWSTYLWLICHRLLFLRSWITMLITANPSSTALPNHPRIFPPHRFCGVFSSTRMSSFPEGLCPFAMLSTLRLLIPSLRVLFILPESLQPFGFQLCCISFGVSCWTPPTLEAFSNLSSTQRQVWLPTRGRQTHTLSQVALLTTWATMPQVQPCSLCHSSSHSFTLRIHRLRLLAESNSQSQVGALFHIYFCIAQSVPHGHREKTQNREFKLEQSSCLWKAALVWSYTRPLCNLYIYIHIYIYLSIYIYTQSYTGVTPTQEHFLSTKKLRGSTLSTLVLTLPPSIATLDSESPPHRGSKASRKCSSTGACIQFLAGIRLRFVKVQHAPTQELYWKCSVFLQRTLGSDSEPGQGAAGDSAKLSYRVPWEKKNEPGQQAATMASLFALPCTNAL